MNDKSFIESNLYKTLAAELVSRYNDQNAEYEFIAILKMFMTVYYRSVWERYGFHLKMNQVLPDFVVDMDLMKFMGNSTLEAVMPESTSAVVMESPFKMNRQHFHPRNLDLAALKAIIEFCETNKYNVEVHGDSLINPGDTVRVEFNKKETIGEDATQ